MIPGWVDFRDAFLERLSATSVADLRRMMESQSERTRFYCQEILPPVAERLGLAMGEEEYRIDFSFFSTARNGWKVPVIHVESENIASDAHHEVRKLTWLTSPLKILITCAEWSLDRESLIKVWMEIISAQNEILPRSDEYGFIIAEWNERLRFYSFCLSSSLVQVDPEIVLLERSLD